MSSTGPCSQFKLICFPQARLDTVERSLAQPQHLVKLPGGYPQGDLFGYPGGLKKVEYADPQLEARCESLYDSV
jgi:hypothetical protein